jgi:hypothetical protein
MTGPLSALPNFPDSGPSTALSDWEELPHHRMTSSARSRIDSGKVYGEGFGRLEIDDQVKLGGLLDGEIGGLGTFQNLVDVRGTAPKPLEPVRRVGKYRTVRPWLHQIPGPTP